MSNGTKINKLIAKIQIILCLATTLLPFGMTSCYRKDLYLRVDMSEISIEIFEIDLDILWQGTWRTDLKYDWKTAIAGFGEIGYTEPELVKGIIYNVDPETHKRWSSYYKIFDSRGGRVSLNAGATYDMMFHNFGTESILFFQQDDYEAFYVTATTRSSNMQSALRTRAENTNSQMSDTTKHYTNYNQPDELFGTLVTGLEINEDPSVYEKEIDEDGNTTYIYKVNAQLEPYSFIYLFQVILLNNYDAEGARVTGASSMTISGLSQGVNLFSRRTFSNTISITTDDIKPIQHKDTLTYDSLLLKAVYDKAWRSSKIVKQSPTPDPITTLNTDVFATRVLTWGLPGIIPQLSTRAGTKAEEYDKNYIGIDLILRNKHTYNATVDITRQMHEHPTGGVITIIIDAGTDDEKLEEEIHKKPAGGGSGSGGGGFNASVENWNNEVNAEISI